ncbi:MAG: Rho termination factor N-terminal domain-containing protein [Lachnospiraceae bacterium]|nr:Rho termination factor N-terminal domain-containing protein [Lachnospiraceae bacterium]
MTGRAAAAETTAAAVVFDESYTVAQLKTIAKGKGITGYSSMSKADLLEVLNGKCE